MERKSACLIMLAAFGMLASSEVAYSGDCGCARPAPVVMAEADCGCAAAACCGTGTGLAQIAGFYSHHGLCSHHGVYGHYPFSGSFLSGYEGLPNMDGGVSTTVIRITVTDARGSIQTSIHKYFDCLVGIPDGLSYLTGPRELSRQNLHDSDMG